MPRNKEENIACPKCGKTVHVALPTEVSYTDPKFQHSCGYKGALRWQREHLAPKKKKLSR